MSDMLNQTKLITTNLERLLSIAMLTPMDDPHTATCRWGAPTLLWGPPGIGKSGRVFQATESCALPLGTVYLSTHQPEDISGVFMPDGKGGVMTVCTLPQVNALIEAGKGVLLLDELTCARPAMQGAGLAVIYERYIAGKRLPGRIRVIGAANPPEDAAGGWNLAPPMANRFLHFNIGCPSVDEWVTWLLTGDSGTIIPINQGEEVILRRWGDVYAKVRGLGAGFMKKYRSVKHGKEERNTLHHLPADGHIDRSRAWASPRSWEVALRCVAAAECLGEKDLGLELLGASVGTGYAAAWAEWVAYANLPDPKDVLENGWTPDKRRLDVAMAILSSAISFALAKTDKAEQRRYAIMSWKLINTARKENLADLALAPGAALMRAGYTTKAGPDVEVVCRDAISQFGATGLANFVAKLDERA
jgi:MoxR-like ATPase